MKRFWLFFGFIVLGAGCESDKDTISNQSVPTISAMTPSQVFRGQTINNGRIIGTNFTGVLVINLGPGIEVREIQGVTPTEIGVRFYVNLDAQPGSRTISINTAAGTATSATSLSVDGNRVPIANFTFDPPTGVAATTFNFNASLSNDPDGQISKYQWDFGDGATAEGMTVKHKYNNAGNFKVKLTVTDGEQATGFSEKELPVKDGKVPIARFSVSPNNGDTNTKFTFDASASQDRSGRFAGCQ